MFNIMLSSVLRVNDHYYSQRITRTNPITPKPPLSYYEIPGDIGVRIRISPSETLVGFYLSRLQRLRPILGQENI